MDRQEVLNYILDLLEKMKSPSDDGILKLFLPTALQYLDEFVQSELLSRRLGYLCCKKIGYMLNNVAESNLMTSPTQNEAIKTEPKENEKDKKETPITNPMQNTLVEYRNCPHHRDLILQLSCIIQTITLECPISLVWCSAGSGTFWYGSPLDLLPMAPSMLPMPARCDTISYKKQLRHAENSIRERSKRAEGRWCTDKWQACPTGWYILEL